MTQIDSFVGEKFGRLTVLGIGGQAKDRHTLWMCLCECGNSALVRRNDLVTGHIKSCGCMRRATHGGRRAEKSERLYFVWRGMISRCQCESATGYEYYGARGISVCEEWSDYSAFREWAYKNGYDDSAKKYACTLDRIDVNGNYCPDNCRWVGMSVQNENKRKSVMTGGADNG